MPRPSAHFLGNGTCMYFNTVSCKLNSLQVDTTTATYSCVRPVAVRPVAYPKNASVAGSVQLGVAV